MGFTLNDNKYLVMYYVSSAYQPAVEMRLKDNNSKVK